MVKRRVFQNKKKKKDVRKKVVEGEKLSPNDPLYFKKLGARGGTGNKLAHARDPDYFARLAILSHQVRRENRDEAERQREARGN